MTILFIALALLLVALAIVILVASSKPDTFQVARSVAIQATPQAIGPWIANFHRWTDWSPWDHLDPDLERTYDGAPEGVGARYGWKGRKSGEGRMELREFEPGRRVGIRIEFLKPFRASNDVEFLLEAQGASTFVTWTMRGANTFFPGKLMDVFLDKDKFLGKDFQKGLEALRSRVENPHR
jgi:hypothetical protein